jgi:DNA-binding NtrC family response regulator
MPGPIQPIPQADNLSGHFSVLVVDEERSSREALKQVAGQLGFMVAAAENFASAMRQLSVHPADLVVLEVGPSAVAAQDMVAGIKALQPQSEIVLTGSNAHLPSLLEAVDGCACEFLRKPFKNEELMRVLRRASGRRLDLQPNGDGNHGMVGQSPEMRRLQRIVQRTASSSHPVLIVGEKGTGKEKLARLIHATGALRDRPFVVVDCASSAPALLEGRLFGLNSSTGMEQPVLANGGTVFLDAVGEMPLSIQGKLFRVLQEKELRVSSGNPVAVNARVIAATGRDLDAAVQQGTFRRDLYLRLNVVALRLPPLRERREDIAALTQHFLEVIRQEKGVQYSLTPDAMKLVLTYDWPGNISELEKALRLAASAAGGEVLAADVLPPEIQASVVQSALPASEPGRILPLAEVERKVILETLQQLNGNKQMAAQLLGIGKTTLYRKLKEYGIDERASQDHHVRPRPPAS